MPPLALCVNHAELLDRKYPTGATSMQQLKAANQSRPTQGFPRHILSTMRCCLAAVAIITWAAVGALAQEVPARIKPLAKRWYRFRSLISAIRRRSGRRPFACRTIPASRSWIRAASCSTTTARADASSAPASRSRWPPTRSGRNRNCSRRACRSSGRYWTAAGIGDRRRGVCRHRPQPTSPAAQ